MASHYTLTSFLRQASNTLLAEYFRTRGIEPGVDFSTLKQRKIEPLADAIERLSEDEQTAVNRDFQNVATLANAAGQLQIVQEAKFRALDVFAGLETQKSLLNRAFWTFLKHPDVFESAVQFAAPYLAGRYWKRGLPVEGGSTGDPGGRISYLEEALSAHFRREEGRGKACKVEHRQRGALHHFHAYPEDYPAAPLTWSRTGLAPLPQRPAFEVVFVFHADQGTLDIYYEGGRPTVERLWQIFSATVLGIENLTRPEKPSFALQNLKSSDLHFVRPPDSPIIDVRIRKLGFAIQGVPSTRITVETDVSKDPDAIHAMVRRTFARTPTDHGHFTLSQAKVISVGLRATIDPGDGRKPRVRSFDLSEKSCSLKYEDVDLLLRQMLADSGIDQTGTQSGAAGGSARQVA